MWFNYGYGKINENQRRGLSYGWGHKITKKETKKRIETRRKNYNGKWVKNPKEYNKQQSINRKKIFQNKKIKEIYLKNNKGVFRHGNIPWSKGKTSEIDSRIPSGRRSGAWQGGKSFELYGLEFNNKLREQIRQRDNYRCQECFRHQNELRTITNKKYKLSIHHIYFNKKNNNPENLISLCKNCHGQTQFNRKHWINYYQNKLIGEM